MNCFDLFNANTSCMNACITRDPFHAQVPAVTHLYKYIYSPLLAIFCVLFEKLENSPAIETHDQLKKINIHVYMIQGIG